MLLEETGQGWSIKTSDQRQFSLRFLFRVEYFLEILLAASHAGPETRHCDSVIFALLLDKLNVPWGG